MVLDEGTLPQIAEVVSRSAENAMDMDDGAEKGSPSASNEPRILMCAETDDNIQIDSFCWICHESCQEELCKACPRIYHKKCLKSSEKFSTDGVCPECQVESIGGTILPSYPKLKQILTFAVYRVFSREKTGSVFMTWPQYLLSNKLCHVIDMEVLIDKINGEIPFKNAAEFFSEVKWMEHNGYIVFEESTTTAKRLVRNFKTELLDIEACPECYYNKYSDDIDDNYFTIPCMTPHELVWAKLKGFPYWPAKCLKIVDGFADVRFFGTHDMSRIAVKNCYQLSVDNPLAKKDKLKQAKYLESVEECNEYVSNYERKYGHYIYAPVKTALVARQNTKSRKKRDISYTHSKTIVTSAQDSVDDATQEISAVNAENMTLSVSKIGATSCVTSSSCKNISPEKGTDNEISHDVSNVPYSHASESSVALTNASSIANYLTNSANSKSVVQSVAANLSILFDSNSRNNVDFDKIPPSSVNPESINCSILSSNNSDGNAIATGNGNLNNILVDTSFEATLMSHMELRGRCSDLLDSLFCRIPGFNQFSRKARIMYQVLSFHVWMGFVQEFGERADQQVAKMAKRLHFAELYIDLLEGRLAQTEKELAEQKLTTKQRTEKAAVFMDIVKRSVVTETDCKWKTELEDKEKIIDLKDEIIDEKKKEEIKLTNTINELKNENSELLSKQQELQNNFDKLQIELENLKIKINDLAIENKEALHQQMNKKEMEKNLAVIEAKRSDWCIKCIKPASIHCCLNTNYCSKDCQEKDLKDHKSLCTNYTAGTSSDQCNFKLLQTSSVRSLSISFPSTSDYAFPHQSTNYANILPMIQPTIFDHSSGVLDAATAAFHNVPTSAPPVHNIPTSATPLHNMSAPAADISSSLTKQANSKRKSRKSTTTKLKKPRK